MKTRQETREIAVGIAALGLLVAVTVLSNMRHQLWGSADNDTYRVVATFNRIDGVDVGAAAMVSGIRIGKVESLVVDPNYRVRMTMRISREVLLPTDSSASIQTDGLFGPKSVRIEPGGAETNLADGGVIDFTQDSVVVSDLLDLIISEGKQARAAQPAPDAKEGESR